MSYKITEEGNISTVFLNGEIDMDVTEKAKLFCRWLSWQRSSFEFKRCILYGLFWNFCIN